MDKPRFVYVVYIRTTPEKLWKALLDPEFTRNYWAETWQESDWKIGSPWKIMTPDGRVADTGEVVVFEPHRKLTVTWRHELRAEIRAEGYSRLTYELEPMGDTVKLTLVHEFDKPDSKLQDAVSGGWPAILCSLKSLLETGESLEMSRKWPEGI